MLLSQLNYRRTSRRGPIRRRHQAATVIYSVSSWVAGGWTFAASRGNRDFVAAAGRVLSHRSRFLRVEHMAGGPASAGGGDFTHGRIHDAHHRDARRSRRSGGLAVAGSAAEPQSVRSGAVLFSRGYDCSRDRCAGSRRFLARRSDFRPPRNHHSADTSIVVGKHIMSKLTANDRTHAVTIALARGVFPL